VNRFHLFNGALQIFDVDHGQCALLSMPGLFGSVHYVMIDCGHAVNFRGGPWYPGAHLQKMGVKYIDMLVCTNFDEDHMSGFCDLNERGITVGYILCNPTVAPNTIIKLKTEDGMGDGIKELATMLSARQAIGWNQEPPMIPGVDNMIWTWNPYPAFDDENNLSLVFTLDVLGFRFMFAGDMERKGWKNIFNTCPAFGPVVAGVDVLIAPHHGRQNGIYEDMYDVNGCKPRLVVISDDYKQYATQETTQYYGRKASGILYFRGQYDPRKVLTTRSDGPIRFSFLEGRCEVW